MTLAVLISFCIFLMLPMASPSWDPVFTCAYFLLVLKQLDIYKAINRQNMEEGVCVWGGQGSPVLHAPPSTPSYAPAFKFQHMLK